MLEGDIWFWTFNKCIIQSCSPTHTRTCPLRYTDDLKNELKQKVFNKPNKWQFGRLQTCQRVSKERQKKSSQRKVFFVHLCDGTKHSFNWKLNPYIEVRWTILISMYILYACERSARRINIPIETEIECIKWVCNVIRNNIWDACESKMRLLCSCVYETTILVYIDAFNWIHSFFLVNVLNCIDFFFLMLVKLKLRFFELFLCHFIKTTFQSYDMTKMYILGSKKCDFVNKEKKNELNKVETTKAMWYVVIFLLLRFTNSTHTYKYKSLSSELCWYV